MFEKFYENDFNEKRNLKIYRETLVDIFRDRLHPCAELAFFPGKMQKRAESAPARDDPDH